MDENRAVPIPHSSSILEFYCSTNSPSAAPHVHQTAIITNLHLTISISKMLGSSAVMRLQCHMWARLHLNVHPSSSFRIEGQSFHSSANISCSVKPTCHSNSFIPRPKTMYIHHSFIIVVVVGSPKYTKKVVFYSHLTLS